MRIRIAIYFLSAIVFLFSACSDDETFTMSKNARLAFSVDTVMMDTAFANVPSPQKTFYSYNKGNDGIRISSVRLEKGNASGFLVNVDGRFLGPQGGYRQNDFEIRKGDSLRVFVKILPRESDANVPVQVDDNLIFTFENGVEQSLPLRAWSWNANILNNVSIDNDTTFSNEKPVLVRGKLTVEEGATLTIIPGTQLFFFDNSKMEVYGRLISKGEPGKQVIMRGVRLDRMFDYLPYDNISGQWDGLTFKESSYDNVMLYTDLHSSNNGIEIDSSDVSRLKMDIQQSTIHNCKGYGIACVKSSIKIANSQITNTLLDCLYVDGGKAEVNSCTIAQFYPFDLMRGYALHVNCDALSGNNFFNCNNTLVTGYGEDVMLIECEKIMTCHFENCIIRTPQDALGDYVSQFTDVVFESKDDTLTTGEKHFVTIDSEKLKYDFHLDSISSAIDKASAATSSVVDHDGKERGPKPDIGAYEYIK